MASGRNNRGPRVTFKFLFHMKRKLMVLFVIIIACLIALVGRLAYIELKSGGRYEKIVLSNQEYTSTTIPFRRGDIVDRKGTVLATSTDVYNVILDCSVLTFRDSYLEPTMEALRACFDEDDLLVGFEEIESYIEGNPSSQYFKIGNRLPADKIAAFEAMQSEDSNIQGIWFDEEYTRDYPYGSLASSLIGYTTSGDLGIGGIEDSYNDVLNGTDGRQYGYLNTDSNYEITRKEAVDGETVVSTIDVNLQSICEEKMQEFYDDLTVTGTSKETVEVVDTGEVDEDGEPIEVEEVTGSVESIEGGAKHIAALMMDPNTGEVLAMADYPSYDYTLTATENLERFYTQAEIDAMDEDERSDAAEQLKQNYCITYTFEPGSTAKPFTVACGLETGTLTDGMTFYCDGGEQIADYYIHCVNNNGHGEETISGALADSCNDSLMQMSYLIGADNFARYQQIFNFGLRTNIDLPGESRTDTLIYSKDELTRINLATNAFGQNFNVTMIQLGTAYCSLVNGGDYYLPHVVSGLLDREGNTVETIEPTLLRETVSDETSEMLIGYLQDVVNEGTGSVGKVDGYSMCGKTGTAQKYEEDANGNVTSHRAEGKYLVSYICSVPAENPEVVLYVVVDEPNAEDQAHSSYAQNIAREILEEALPYLNIYPDEELTGINENVDILGNEISDYSDEDEDWYDDEDEDWYYDADVSWDEDWDDDDDDDYWDDDDDDYWDDDDDDYWDDDDDDDDDYWDDDWDDDD